MRLVLMSNKAIAAAVARRPAGYLAEFERRVVRRDARGAWVDADSAAWRAMKDKYAPARHAERAKRWTRAKAHRDAATRKLWAELHARPFSGYDPATEPAWFGGWLARVPCGDCKTHAKEILATNPMDFSTPERYFASGVAFHNAVNALPEAGKRQWTVDEARAAITATGPRTRTSAAR